MQRLSTRLSEQGITFYYMQCYDKDSIYPEYYVEGVRQFGDLSRANQIVTGLKNNTDVNVIPTYEALLEHKDQEMLYFKAIYTIYFCTFDINTTVSTWLHRGNKSAARTFFTWKPRAFSSATSRARVAGSQET